MAKLLVGVDFSVSDVLPILEIEERLDCEAEPRRLKLDFFLLAGGYFGGVTATGLSPLESHCPVSCSSVVSVTALESSVEGTSPEWGSSGISSCSSMCLSSGESLAVDDRLTDKRRVQLCLYLGLVGGESVNLS